VMVFNVLIIRFVEWFHCDVLRGVFEPQIRLGTVLVLFLKKVKKILLQMQL
jgi:pentose-5-phosphate-3-epimerase